ncbi:hypothetical protein RN04_09045 [Arthrobacter sp. W1]|nr:hypothetical protein RN04_09045 [Arthrobacter sp. W1]
MDPRSASPDAARFPGPRADSRVADDAIRAHLRGDYDSATALLQDACQQHLDNGDAPGALRTMFQLAMVNGTSGHYVLFNGWMSRYRRMLEEQLQQRPADPRSTPELEVAEGYLDVMVVHRSLGAGFSPQAERAAQILDIGNRHGCGDLICLGLTALGRAAIEQARIPDGLAQLDEAMVRALDGDCAPLLRGIILCAAIEACQQIGDLQRVAEWTGALASWQEGTEGMTAFTGECALHTGQLLALRGRWDEALDEFASARRRFENNNQAYAAGAAERERGDLLLARGELDDARQAYETASGHGCDPQPGLARLWVRSGESEAAMAAIERALAEHPLPSLRIGLLPAAVEIAVALGALERAGQLVSELDELAVLSSCEHTVAGAACAHAVLELARNDPSAALPYARKAFLGWNALGCPYRSAQARVVLAAALDRLGDAASARAELQAAAQAFEHLGALPEQLATRQLEARAASDRAVGADGLTGRELEVLRLVSAGRSNRQVAAELCLSEKTVARHLSNIFTKLGVSSRTAAAAWAHSRQLL